MAKVTTKRRRKEPSQASMFNQLSDYAEGLPSDDNRGDGDTKPPTETDRIAALERTIQLLQEQQERTEAANVALTARAAPPVAPTPPKGVSFEGLPDPVDDPAGYSRELNARIDTMIQERLNYDAASRQHANQSAQTKDALWDDFKEEFPEYAEDEDRVGFVTQKVLKRAQARGLDIERYMTGNSQRFYGDIVKEYNTVFGAPQPDDEAEDDYEDTRPAPRRRARDESEPRGRTDGIFGGIDPGAGRGRGRGREAPDDNQPGDMIKELQEMQRKTGYW
jgi:hypothetical protein